MAKKDDEEMVTTEEKPAFSLVVREPFEDYQRGDHITDAEAIANIGDNLRHCVKVAA